MLVNLHVNGSLQMLGIVCENFERNRHVTVMKLLNCGRICCLILPINWVMKVNVQV